MSFDEGNFREQVNRALEQVRTILEVNKAPKLPEDVNHRYEDKFVLAEFLTRASFAAERNLLEAFGFSEENLSTALEWSKTRAVTLRLRSEEKCSFTKEETRKIESPEHVTEVSGVHGLKERFKQKMVTKVLRLLIKGD